MKAKTRTNQPVYYFFESQQDMTHLSGSFLNSLVAGDIVVKQTGEQQHAYIVSYKQDGTGICLTYTDASVVETISYDYVGGNWVYNSTDVQSIDVKSIIESGTISNAKPLYYHPIIMVKQNGDTKFSISLIVINNSGTPFTWETLKQWVSTNNISNLNACGQITDGTYNINASHIYVSNSNYTVYGIDVDIKVYGGISITNEEIPVFVDGVNKIN